MKKENKIEAVANIYIYIYIYINGIVSDFTLPVYNDCQYKQLLC